MTDASLLVPGTSGTKLLLDNEDIGWPVDMKLASWFGGDNPLVELIRQKLGFATDVEVRQLLSMQFSTDPSIIAPLRTTLADGDMTPGPVIRAAYTQFEGIESFVYDWRSDIRHSGEKLWHHLRDGKPPHGRWKIVSHSQGGLVVAAAAYACAQENGGSDTEFSKYVSHSVFIAVPFYGTIDAADALARGEELSAAFAPELAEAFRTWPSLHQMLPSWRGSVRIQFGGRLRKLSYSLLDDRAWAHYPGVLPALLDRARRTRAEVLDAPIAMMNGVKLLILMSRGHPTRTYVTKNADGLGFVDGVEVGDTLVPYETTRAMMNDIEQRRSWALGHSGDGIAKHSMLANDPVVASAVERFFDQNQDPSP